MNKFKVGDKVVILDGRNIKGYKGTWVTEMERFVGRVGRVQTPVTFLNGRGYRLEEYPYTFDERGLELVDSAITIERHGQKMVAKYNGKVGVAKCSDDDEFDVFIGANLALQRLFGKEEKTEEPKWSEGDIVRAKENPFVAKGTIGKVRTVDHRDKELPVEVRFEDCMSGHWMRPAYIEKIDI